MTPPPIWSLVEKWQSTYISQDSCAAELEALLRAHADYQASRISYLKSTAKSPDEAYTKGYLAGLSNWERHGDILGVPKEVPE